jgi:hypothetical protein
MPLSGLNPAPVRPRGGVAKVELVPASEYAGGVPPAGSAWAFREDRARYLARQAGASVLVPLTRHILQIDLAATPSGRRAADELCAAAAAPGIVAVVTTASGETLTAGYSPRFGSAYPLRLTRREDDSGLSPADFPTISITLESVC